MPPVRHLRSPSLDIKPYATPAESSASPNTVPAGKPKRTPGTPWSGDEYIALFDLAIKNAKFDGGMEGRTKSQCYQTFLWVADREGG